MSEALASMPSEEEIARALCEARHQMPMSPGQWDAEMAHIREMEAKHPTYITGFSTGTDAVRQARAILALFAPILAEKERDNRQLKLEVAEKEETSRISIACWRDKANELEAALAGERERAAMAALDLSIEFDEQAMAFDKKGQPDQAMLASAKAFGASCAAEAIRAAAIRAGE